MILRAVDWWQPTRRRFGYLDRNTAQTRGFWVSLLSWFALKTKGANAASLGIDSALVGSKGVERNARLLGIVITMVSLKSKATNAFDMGIEACPVRRTGDGGSEP